MTRVLVVEDDAQTAAEIAAALGDHGFEVECAYTGQDALDRAVADRYSAIVLDRMLPGGIDGLTVLSTLRGLSVDAPVLILSALSAVDERVRGLRAGGDDYLTKPFESLELTARIEVLLRRRGRPRSRDHAAGRRSGGGSAEARGASAAAGSSTCCRANTVCSNT